MNRSRQRRIGVNMMSVATSSTARKAGVSRYALAIVEALAQLGPEVGFELHVRPDFEPPASWRDLANLRLRRVRVYKAVEYSAGWWPAALRYDSWFAPAYDLLRTCPKRQVPMVHDVFPITHPEWFPDATVASIARGVRDASRVGRPILANSEFTKRTLCEHLGVAERRVVVTPLGPGHTPHAVDPASVSDEFLKGLGVPFSRFFLTISTLEPRKNLGTLLNAFARTSGDVGLVLVGGRGWKEEQALSRLTDPDLEGRVAWIGYVGDEALSALLARCEAYICPSLSEGFGLPVLEAMRAGAPVLSSSAGALPEVGGDAVRYFNPLDEDALASLMNLTTTEAALRQERSRLGQTQAARFSWQIAAELTMAALLG